MGAASFAGAPGHITLRGNRSTCLDTRGATDRAPVRMVRCDSTASSQLFTFDRKNGYIHTSGKGQCEEGPPCCLEDYFGNDQMITIWGCSDSRGKQFAYNNATGALSNAHTDPQWRPRIECMTAHMASPGAGVTMSKCDAADPAQSWDIGGGPLPPVSPPVVPSCQAMGCVSYRPDLPCQCNTACAQWGNCCPDFETTCGHHTDPWGGCTSIDGLWAPDDAPQSSLSITQSGCNLQASDAAEDWSLVNGRFVDQWDITMTFVYAGGKTSVRSGHLRGCDWQSCPQGSMLHWANGVTWTKQG